MISDDWTSGFEVNEIDSAWDSIAHSIQLSILEQMRSSELREHCAVLDPGKKPCME